MQKKYIAIVAPIGAGKTTAAKFFQDKGFGAYKLSYAIYEEADKRGLDKEDRTTLQDLGDELRRKNGLTVLAEAAIRKVAQSDKNFVIESIRNHHELKFLKDKLGDKLIILAIDAPNSIRYKRVVDRKGQYK